MHRIVAPGAERAILWAGVDWQPLSSRAAEAATGSSIECRNIALTNEKPEQVEPINTGPDNEKRGRMRLSIKWPNAQHSGLPACGKVVWAR
ncbi:hypothetical protein HORIV_47940 [Vreelandella olivaria]|uniref:Uncharacterized protein n=1 Tax=Vreelandella olivaria TaxID=390919 RepID=A0ABM7GNV5_9GAMM|nr:hypothetical protein HORIV_47940 [Halomonas olivaria]